MGHQQKSKEDHWKPHESKDIKGNRRKSLTQTGPQETKENRRKLLEIKGNQKEVIGNQRRSTETNQ